MLGGEGGEVGRGEGGGGCTANLIFFCDFIFTQNRSATGFYRFQNFQTRELSS